MNGLIAWWARNSVAANLVMIGIFVAGTIGFSQMEREMDPQVRFPGLQIMFPGRVLPRRKSKNRLLPGLKSPSVTWMRLNGSAPLRVKAAARFTSSRNSRLISHSL